MISQMLNLRIWQVENHQNMLICLSIKRLTIFFEKALRGLMIAISLYLLPSINEQIDSILRTSALRVLENKDRDEDFWLS
jgi:hypothetical protein